MTVDGRPYESLQPWCRLLGVDYLDTLADLRSRSWASLRDHDGTVMVDERTLLMWLFTVDADQVVNVALREQLIAYQNEASAAFESPHMQAETTALLFEPTDRSQA